jgi:transcriptional regulator with XRE-family HTH domain
VSDLYRLLGKQIALYRRRASLTQEQLAEATGYSVDFIGLVERGINAPTVKRLEDIAAVLNVEIWQLFTISEQAPFLSGSKNEKRKKGSRTAVKHINRRN